MDVKVGDLPEERMIPWLVEQLVSDFYEAEMRQGMCTNMEQFCYVKAEDTLETAVSTVVLEG